MMETIAQKKTKLRKELRQKRRMQDQETLSKDSFNICSRLLALPEVQEAKCIFCYVSCAGEVETHALIESLLQAGKTVAVPRCKAEHQMDCVPIKSFDELSVGAYGILEPALSKPAITPEQIDFAIIPAVACGRDGSRLGQGGGYYDGFLAAANCSFTAICQQMFLLPEIPCEAFDQKMKMIVTQDHVLRFEEL